MAKYRDNDSVFVIDINEEDVAQINTPLTGLKKYVCQLRIITQ